MFSRNIGASSTICKGVKVVNLSANWPLIWFQSSPPYTLALNTAIAVRYNLSFTKSIVTRWVWTPCVSWGLSQQLIENHLYIHLVCAHISSGHNLLIQICKWLTENHEYIWTEKSSAHLFHRWHTFRPSAFVSSQFLLQDNIKQIDSTY